MGRRNEGVPKPCAFDTDDGSVIGVVKRDTVAVDFVGVSCRGDLAQSQSESERKSYSA